ncbi:hypothetical protein ACFL7M_18105, partial [Thermodesulfobacteriota bacterium]
MRRIILLEMCSKNKKLPTRIVIEKNLNRSFEFGNFKFDRAHFGTFDFEICCFSNHQIIIDFLEKT